MGPLFFLTTTETLKQEKGEMKEQNHFTKEEAESKVGTSVWCTDKDSRVVPQGTMGQVIGAVPLDRTGFILAHRLDPRSQFWKVVVDWDIPTKHLYSFTKEEYEEYLDELPADW